MACTEELRLPVELLLIVLHQLDKACLSVCSLVSRDFLELSRGILFRKLICRLQRRQHIDSSYHHTPHLPESLDDVLAYLRASSDVCAHIRHLCLWRKLWSRGGGRHAFFEESRLETLIEIIKCLPNLHTLEMDGISFSAPESLLFGSPIVSSLKALRLIGWKLFGGAQSAGGLFHLLSLFGEVDTVFISCIDGRVEELGEDTAALASRVATKIHSLEVRPRPDILEYLALLPNISTLHSLNLPEIPYYALEPFFAAAGRSLRHLAFTLLDSPSLAQYKAQLSPPDLAPLDLALLPTLESASIALGALVFPADPDARSDATAVAPTATADATVDVFLYGTAYATLAALVRAFAPTLHTLTLRIACLQMTGIFAARRRAGAGAGAAAAEPVPAVVAVGGVPLQGEWTLLDGLLAERVDADTDGGLRVVRLKESVRGRFEKGEREQLGRLLPRLAKKGVLEFV